METIKKNIKGTTQEELVVQAQYILDSMTENVNFPNPTIGLDAFSTTIGKYQEALAKAESRDKEDIISKNQRKAELEDAITSLFNYVVSVGGTNIEVLTSSGFPLRKTPSPVGNMPQPVDFRSEMGAANSGSIRLSVKAVNGAKVYSFEWMEALSPEVNNWSTQMSTESRTKIDNLTPGTKYHFRVAAIGANGTGPYSTWISTYMS